MVQFSDLVAIGNIARVNETANKDNQPDDHNTFQAKIDALIDAGVTLEEAHDLLAGNFSALLDAYDANEVLAALDGPMAGMHVPVGGLDHVYYEPDGVRRVAIGGDSTWQQTTGLCSFGQGGKGTSAERLATVWQRRGLGQLISPGIRPIWYSGSAWAFASGYAEYSILAGAPVAVNRATAGAADVAPYGRAVQIPTRNDIVRWTKPTLGPAWWWGRQIVGFEVLYVDAINGGADDSYMVDNDGTWRNLGREKLGDNKLKTVYIVRNVNSTIDFRGARADNFNSTWTFVAIRPYWVHPYVGTIPGDYFYVDNLGHDSNFLSSFVNSTSTGDPLAILNNVVNPIGTPGLTPPPKLFLGCWTNDQGFSPTSIHWTDNLTALLNRVRAGAGDMVHMSSFEQSSRASIDVLTNYNGILEYSNQHNFRALSLAWAVANAVPYVDFKRAWDARGFVGQAQANPTLCNALHPTQLGINDETWRLRLLADLYS